MNAVEIEEALSNLCKAPFEHEVFAFQFLESFGRKETEVKRLKKGNTNKSDIGGVLQRNHIHIKVCEKGEVSQTLDALRQSPATGKAKAKYILATDGETLEAENLIEGDTIACDFKDVHDHLGFLLGLAGISTVKQIKESAFDIKATGRLNRLYLQLLKDNPDWATVERRHDMNHFMARLIFCFFAEDTDILNGEDLFTATIEQMGDATNTHEVMAEIFRAMNTKLEDRKAENIRAYANGFPYVNGELFAGSVEVPKFTKMARSYFLHIGRLDWRQINPDIFGSMIQAVADEEERGNLGMHYTSVPNILKVLNPLFLDDLRNNLEEAKINPRKLLNLKNRMAKIRVFDPACGSGNFLVIAYKQMREIEAEINIRRGEIQSKSVIPLTNFRGIEINDFPAEIARLALIIAEYQCDVIYRGQKEALLDFLPLDKQNWITCGNALRIDWLTVCPPTGKSVKLQGDDLFSSPLEQAEIDFENEGGETYICGNPPYLGSTWQSKEQKEDLKANFDGRTKSWKSLDYVAGWFMKAADYGRQTPTVSAFVSTNSICQGQQVPILWPLINQTKHEIAFAHTSFKWANLASHNAGVTVVIVGLAEKGKRAKKLYSLDDKGQTISRDAENINAYLVAGPQVVLGKRAKPLSNIFEMDRGNGATDGGHLLLDPDALAKLNLSPEDKEHYIRPFFGSAEYIRGLSRFCLWIKDEDVASAQQLPTITARIEQVRKMRLSSAKAATRKGAEFPHKFDERRQIGGETVIAVPRVSSENRQFLPCGYLPPNSIVSDSAFALYDAPLWNMALIASRIHLVWIATVCGKLKTDFRYSNTIGWNTFPVPKLTQKNKDDLTRCAENILLAREEHFPATIAELYDPENMPENLRAAHDANDEVLERIYIGRRFKNDTERLEHLFALYTEMTTKVEAG